MKPETFTINVTASDIEVGEVANCFQCPIAKAMFRQIPHCSSASARDTFLRFIRGAKLYIANTPASAKVFMNDFDSGKVVTPFSFTADFHRENS